MGRVVRCRTDEVGGARACMFGRIIENKVRLGKLAGREGQL